MFKIVINSGAHGIAGVVMGGSAPRLTAVSARLRQGTGVDFGTIARRRTGVEQLM